MRLEYENNKWEKEIYCDPWLIGEMNSNEQGLWFESREDRLGRWRRKGKVRRLTLKVNEVMDKILTSREQEALRLSTVCKNVSEVGRKMVPAITR